MLALQLTFPKAGGQKTGAHSCAPPRSIHIHFAQKQNLPLPKFRISHSEFRIFLTPMGLVLAPSPRELSAQPTEGVFQKSSDKRGTQECVPYKITRTAISHRPLYGFSLYGGKRGICRVRFVRRARILARRQASLGGSCQP